MPNVVPNLAENILHGFGLLAPHTWRDVRVDVQRHAHLRMSQHLLHHSGWHALLQQERGVGVPQSVEGYVRQTSLLQEFGVLLEGRCGD